MKKTVLCMALLGLVTSLGTLAHSQEQPRSNPVPTLTVTAQGEASAAPDRATVELGAEAQGKDAAAAQSQVNTIIQKALTQIRAVGIEERQIRTSNLQLYPVYEQQKPGDEKAPRVVAYRATNTLQIKVEKLDLIGKVIDAGVTAGANRVENVNFDLKNDLAARTEALQKAVADARAKAEVLANALNVTLVEIIAVEEGGVNVIPPRPMQAELYARSDAKMTSVQPGELQIQASVTLRYRIQAR
jgi:uncharacterized protein YggE